MSELELFLNRGLNDVDTGGQTSTVGETSIANNGREVFLTGNWYASRSLDHGDSWDFVSPFNLLPPADDGFCCDQTVLYDPSRDLTFWLLQYVEVAGSNTLRVAVKRGPNLARNDWFWWDFRPEGVDPAFQGEWFDYNHAALSSNFLYVATNAFDASNNKFTRAVVLRMPLDELEAGEDLGFDFFETTELGSLRCTQGARDVMYFASHESQSQLRLFTWPESSASVAEQVVDISTWNEGSYSAPGPDGRDWLGRLDGRITGAWVAAGVLGFMWSANRQGTARPFPFVRVVRLDESSGQLIDEPDIWSPDFAYAYPEASPNDRGHLGITLFRGGGDRHPGHVVGIWDDFSNPWSLKATRNGSHGPSDGKWGDYLACRRHSPDGLTWIACGFTLQGGSTRDEIEPRVVHFGRARDANGASRWV